MGEEDKSRFYLVHGYNGGTEKHWYPWLRKQLKEGSLKVLELPEPSKPQSDPWLNAVQEQIKVMNEDTVLIGHSLGCITLIRYLLEGYEGEKIRALFLVAGFMDGLEHFSSFFNSQLPLKDLKKKVQHITVIASKDDTIVPWQLSQSLATAIDGNFFLLDHQGHFLDREGCTELPFLLAEIQSL